MVHCRRTLGYEDVLERLEQKGISIRVASPKLVMEEVCIVTMETLKRAIQVHRKLTKTLLN